MFSTKNKGAARPRHSAETTPASKEKRRKKVTPAGPESLTYVDYKLVVNEDGTRMYVSPEEAIRIETVKRVREGKEVDLKNGVNSLMSERAAEDELPLPTPVEVIEIGRKSRKDGGEKKRGFFERAFSSGRKSKDNKSLKPETDHVESITCLDYKMVTTEDGKRMFVTQEEAERLEEDKRTARGRPLTFHAPEQDEVEDTKKYSSDPCLLGDDDDFIIELKTVVESKLSEARDSYKSLVQSSATGDTVYETPINSSDEETELPPPPRPQDHYEKDEEERGQSERVPWHKENNSEDVPSVDEVVLSTIPSTPKKLIVAGWIEEHIAEGEFPAPPAEMPPPIPSTPPPDSPVEVIRSESPVEKVPPPLPKFSPLSSNRTENQAIIKTTDSYPVLKDIESDDPLPPEPVVIGEKNRPEKRKRLKKQAKKQERQPNFFNRLFNSGRKPLRIHTLEDVLHTDTEGYADSESSESEEDAKVAEKTPKLMKLFGAKEKTKINRENALRRSRNNFLEGFFPKSENNLDRTKKQLGLHNKSDAEVPKVLVKDSFASTDDGPHFDLLETHSSLEPENAPQVKEQKPKFAWFGLKKSKSGDLQPVNSEKNHGFWSSDSELMKKKKKKIQSDAKSDKTRQNKGKSSEVVESYVNIARETSSSEDEETKYNENTFKRTFSFASIWKKPDKSKHDDKRQVQSDNEGAIDSETNPGYGDIIFRRSKRKSGGKKNKQAAKDSKVSDVNIASEVDDWPTSDTSGDYYKKITPSSPKTTTKSGESSKWSLFGLRSARPDEIPKDKVKKSDKKDKKTKDVAKSTGPVMQLMTVFGSGHFQDENDTGGGYSTGDITYSSDSDVENKGYFGAMSPSNDEADVEGRRTLEKEVEPLLCPEGTYRAVDRDSLEHPQENTDVNNAVETKKQKTVSIIADDPPKKKKAVRKPDTSILGILGLSNPRMEYEINHASEDGKNKKGKKRGKSDGKENKSKKPKTGVANIFGSKERVKKEENKIEEDMPPTHAGNKKLLSIFGSKEAGKDPKGTKKSVENADADLGKQMERSVAAIFGSNESNHRDGKTTPRTSESSKSKAKFSLFTSKNVKATEEGKIGLPEDVTNSGKSESPKTKKPIKKTSVAALFGSKGKLTENQKNIALEAPQKIHFLFGAEPKVHEKSETESPPCEEKMGKNPAEKNGTNTENETTKKVAGKEQSSWFSSKPKDLNHDSENIVKPTKDTHKTRWFGSNPKVGEEPKFSIFERSESVDTCSSVSSVEGKKVRGSYLFNNSDKEAVKSDSGMDCRKSSTCSVDSEDSSGRGGLAIANPVGKWGPRKKSVSDIMRSTSGEYCFNGDEVEKMQVEPVVLRSFKIFDDDGHTLEKARPVSLEVSDGKKARGLRPLSVHVPMDLGSDTESADHGSTDKSSVSKLTEPGVKKNRFAFLDLMKKSKSRTDQVQDGPINEPIKETSTAGVDTQQSRDGVVYAELDIVRGGDSAAARAKNIDPDKTEYAEIIHPAPPLTKKEELRKSRENLADMDAVTTTPDGKKEAAV